MLAGNVIEIEAVLQWGWQLRDREPRRRRAFERHRLNRREVWRSSTPPRRMLGRRAPASPVPDDCRRLNLTQTSLTGLRNAASSLPPRSEDVGFGGAYAWACAWL